MMAEAEVRERERERFEDAVLLVLRMEEEATSQRRQVASRSLKGQGQDFPLKPPEGTSPANTWILAQGD